MGNSLDENVTEPVNENASLAAEAAPVAAIPVEPATEPEPLTAAAEPEAEPATAAAGQAPKPPAKPRSSSSFENALGALLTQLYPDYDFELSETGAPASRIVDLWTLPAESKGAPPAPDAASESDRPGKNKWPPRISLTSRPYDYRLHLYISTIKDPSWGVPGKDVLAISTGKKSGIALLMADQKGYFLTSEKVWDLSQLFSVTATGTFKITAPKLQKAAVARFFSLAGFARELAQLLG